MKAVSYRIYLFLILFSPLAFGTVETWSMGIMEGGCFLATFFYFWDLKQKQNPLYQTPGFFLFIVFVFYMGVQLIPLPSFVLEVIAPATNKLYQNTVGISDPITGMPLSIYPNGTLGEFFRYAAYACFYLLTVQFLSDGKKLKQIVKIIFRLSLFLACFAIIQKFAGNGKIFWFRETTSEAGFMGSFFYHNHFAAFMGMMIPLCLALFFYNIPKTDGNFGLRNKVAAFVHHPRFNVYLLLGFSFIILFLSLFLSLSRGGLIASSFSLMLMGGFLFIRGRKTLSGFFALLLVVSVIFLIGTYMGGDVASKFNQAIDQEGNISDYRLIFWKDSWQIIKDFPFFGTGYGTFALIYPAYRSFVRTFFVYHAHSDYIETLMNGGLLALGLIVSFLLVILKQAGKAIKTRRDRYNIYLYFASLTGIITILLHSLVDFNFQNGANGLYFFLLLGILISSSHTRIRKGTGSRLTTISSRLFPYAVLSLTPILFVGSIFFHGGSIIAKNIYAPVGTPFSLSLESSQEELQMASLIAKEATKYDPFSGYYHFAGAYAEQFLGNREEAGELFLQAINRNPAQSTYLQEYGHFLAEEEMIEKARSYLKAGIERDISDVDRYREYAYFLLFINDNQGVLSTVSEAMNLIPKDAKVELDFLIDNGFSNAEIESALPDKVKPHLLFAEYLVKNKQYQIAEPIYRKALLLTPEKERASRYIQLFHFLNQRKRPEEAQNLLKKAAQELPQNKKIQNLLDSFQKMMK